ncbi:MAG: histidine phosphatase family protein [Albidovulum sp.]
MGGELATEMLLIRHAPASICGRLFGRTDVAADCSDLVRIDALRAAIGEVDQVLTSPALRCRQTAGALWPETPEPATDAALWEQDFGSWDGKTYADLPDLGNIGAAELATHRPPGGESFSDLCARVAPPLIRMAGQGGRIAVVAHAGVIRGALALALGSVPVALGFEIAPLSMTRIRALPGGGWSVIAVNWNAA